MMHFVRISIQIPKMVYRSERGALAALAFCLVGFAFLMLSPVAQASSCTARIVRLDGPPGVHQYRAVIESSKLPPFSYIGMALPNGVLVRAECRAAQTACTYETELDCLAAGSYTVRAYGYTDWPGDDMFCETAILLEAEPQAPRVSIAGQLDDAGRYTVTVDYAASSERVVARVVLEMMNANGEFSPVLTRHVEFLPAGSFSTVLFQTLPAASRSVRAVAYHDCSNDLPGVSGVIQTPFAPPQVPRFEFELSDAYPSQRLLVYKYGPDEPYPSSWQIEPDPGRGRPRFRFNGAVKINGAGIAGRNVWLRVIDPADPSDYIPLARRTAGDNRDPLLPKGVLMPEGCANCGTPGGTPLQVTSGPGAAVSVILEGTARFAGDNYQIEASLDPSFTCAGAGEGGSNICPRSVLVTAWKRMYVETSAMFRRGSFLTEELEVDDAEIFVEDVHHHFGSAGTRHFVRLLHARPIKAGAAASPDLDRFYSEDHEVEVVAENRQTQMPAHLALLGGDRIHRRYVLDQSGRRADERPLLRDAVAILGVNDTFAPSPGSVDGAGDSELDRFFATMFVELHPVAEIGYIPAIEFMQLANGFAGEVARRVSDKWSRTVVRQTQEDYGEVLPNHVRLCAGNRPHTRPVQEQPQSEIGVTDVSRDGNASWSWVGNIERLTSSLFGPLRGLDPLRVNYENVAHELVHQWNANIPSPPPPANPPLPPPFGQQPPQATRGHCSFAAAGPDGAVRLCRLHRPWTEAAHRLERGDGLVGLHYELVDGVPHSEYLAVRDAAEPKANVYVP